MSQIAIPNFLSTGGTYPPPLTGPSILNMFYPRNLSVPFSAFRTKSYQLILTYDPTFDEPGVQPPADILRKLADTFNVSIDFIVYGDAEEKAQQSIKDNELLSQFKAVE